ncbi:glucose 1-dehydrogenase [Streptomyces sp. LHD-70]|uniref:SDR family NAD(P)-dependent oxidoreductase n=1 Tax=Streptomyces sp. LHD-70 TaxID=3072140 RepID=UPI00280E393F|nr:glucose 1-dehydrogenase [Streptomyces sp. LHD-70]MDQ8706036.1 glucose 1-dehydrogenase [Streptomyces sp. LHD-70]
MTSFPFEGLPVPLEPPAPSALPRCADRPLFAGRTAVVTGGGAGIGAGIIRALAFHGAQVVLADIDAEAARRTAEQTAEESGVKPVVVIGDIRDPGTVTELTEAAGQADFLVNNVGDYRPSGPFLTSGEADWQRMYELNLLHILRVTRAFLPRMVERGGGGIVNLTSVEGMRGIPGSAVYGALKAAVINFTASLAAEVGQYGVRVNAIAPDLTDTPQTPMWAGTPAKYADQVGRWVPTGRFGHPSDHGDAVVFLLSEQSGFITGTTLRVDGGTLAAPGWFRRDEQRFTNLPRPLR